jgi:hypothetical protein
MRMIGKTLSAVCAQSVQRHSYLAVRPFAFQRTASLYRLCMCSPNCSLAFGTGCDEAEGKRKMTAKPSLRVVENTDTALRNLLNARDTAERELASIDAQMLAYRRSYARERGEFMLPSLSRLRRELLG